MNNQHALLTCVECAKPIEGEVNTSADAAYHWPACPQPKSIAFEVPETPFTDEEIAALSILKL